VASYTVVAPLGAGGMGEVYRAHDEKLDRDVALKVLSPALAEHPDHLRRFIQEARAASSLSHPNIVTIYEVGSENDISFIAMELVNGVTLRDRLAQGPPLSYDDALRIAAKVADGLAAAHERGIVHRDLKPENLVITHQGFVKIVDFGLAKLNLPSTVDGPTLRQTTPGVVLGTISYMSPEQVRGRPVDARSDQFSLGMILYEIFSGVRPFDRDSAGDTMAAIIRDDPPPLSETAPSLDPEVAELVMRCLEKDREKRFASTRELSDDFRRLRGPHVSSDPKSRRISSGYEKTMRLQRPFERLWLRVTAAIVLLAILAAGSILALRRRQPSPARTSIVALGTITPPGVAQAIASQLNEIPSVQVVSPQDLALLGKGATAGQALDASLTQDGLAWRLGTTKESASGDPIPLIDRVIHSVCEATGTKPPRDLASRAGVLPPRQQRDYLHALELLQKRHEPAALGDGIRILESLLVTSRDSALLNAQLSRGLLEHFRATHKVVSLDQATLYANRAATLEPGSVATHMASADLFLMKNDFNKAVAEYDAVLRLQPHSFDAVLGRGSCYFNLGRTVEAENSFRAAIALRPAMARAHYAYGILCLAHGRFDEALKLFQRGTELDPADPGGFANLGATYQSMGRYDEAMRAYEQSLKLRPIASAWSNIGTCQFNLGQYAEAVQSYRHATELDTHDPTLWMNLGDAYRWLKDSKNANEAYARAISTGRNLKDAADATTRAVIAASLAKSGHRAEAGREIEATLQSDPTNAVALYEAAVIATLDGDKERALVYASKAIDAGYPMPDVAADPELTPLHSEPEFKALTTRTKAR